MELTELKEKLKSYNKKDIIFTKHSKLQAFTRDIDLEEIKENVVNPVKLVYAEKQKAKYKNEEKYNCYFAYSKHLYHRLCLMLHPALIPR